MPKVSTWDIIAVTESWSTDDILDSELGLPGMSLIRLDRPTGEGRVLLYPRSDLQCDVVNPPVSALDTIWCILSKRDDFLIGMVYRSPSSTESANDTLLRAMSQVLSAEFNHILRTNQQESAQLIDHLNMLEMLKLAVLLFTLVPAILAQRYTDCAGNGNLVNVTVTPCTQTPCEIRRYTRTELAITFRAGEVCFPTT
ncbi:unnamed protein product [Echinostoma caproni]|uniref:Triple gene block protein 2 n=1 Tax=Echinostoma caproni TaxID=27848 RepID=A0A183A9B0_9TREM|nr:unnamed protein product [Echinostoma caproni]